MSEPVPQKRKALLEKLKLEAPCLVAIDPGTKIVACSGPLTSEAAKKLADSPARREVSRLRESIFGRTTFQVVTWIVT